MGTDGQAEKDKAEIVPGKVSVISSCQCRSRLDSHCDHDSCIYTDDNEIKIQHAQHSLLNMLNVFCLVVLQSQSEQCPDEEEEVESKADRRTVGLRCFQGNRETSEDEPSELVKLFRQFA